VEARKWKEKYTMHYIASSLRSQEKVFSLHGLGGSVLLTNSDASWEEEDTGPPRQVQKVKNAIKAMIARSPSAKARKFVVDR
jgi:hypothetical protein